MSEETEETTETTETTETEASTSTTETETDPADEVAKWKALARKNEEQAKKNADAARKLQELEDAQKSEQEKLTERLTETEKRAAEAELRHMRLEVATDKGLTKAQAKYLTGTTAEELEAAADELIELFAPEEPSGPPLPRRPNPRPRGGGNPTEEPEETDPRKLAADLPRY